jgi:hypothetical protein
MIADMPGAESMEIALSDQAELSSLREWLGWAGQEVSLVPRAPGPGEQGGLDVLSVLAGSGGLIAAIRVLPEFLRAAVPACPCS